MRGARLERVPLLRPQSRQSDAPAPGRIPTRRASEGIATAPGQAASQSTAPASEASLAIPLLALRVIDVLNVIKEREFIGAAVRNPILAAAWENA